MEDIIERLNNINTQISAMDDENIIQFKNKTDNQLNEINLILEKMEKQLLEYDLSEEKCQHIKLNNIKQKMISESLFIHYWLLNENINKLSESAILELESKISGTHDNFVEI